MRGRLTWLLQGRTLQVGIVVVLAIAVLFAFGGRDATAQDGTGSSGTPDYTCGESETGDGGVIRRLCTFDIMNGVGESNGVGSDMQPITVEILDAPTKVEVGAVTGITLRSVWFNRGPDKNLDFAFNLQVFHPPELKIVPDNAVIGSQGFSLEELDALGILVPATLECNEKGTFSFTLAVILSSSVPFDPNPGNDGLQSINYFVDCNNFVVGGVAEIVDVAKPSLAASDSSDMSRALIATVVIGLAAVVVLGAGGWYARKRLIN